MSIGVQAATSAKVWRPGPVDCNACKNTPVQALFEKRMEPLSASWKGFKRIAYHIGFFVADKALSFSKQIPLNISTIINLISIADVLLIVSETWKTANIRFYCQPTCSTLHDDFRHSFIMYGAARKMWCVR